jgi:hypothetical protein
MLTVYIVPNGSTIRRGWGNKESSDSLFISWVTVVQNTHDGWAAVVTKQNVHEVTRR